MNSITKKTAIALIPRDGIFCKDGRGWHTSESGRGHALDWPWPSTVIGAIKTAWGWHYEEGINRSLESNEWPDTTDHVALGATLTLRRTQIGGSNFDWLSTHRVWPVPSDALRLEGESCFHRLELAPPGLPTLGNDDNPALESLWVPETPIRGKPLLKPRWWSDESFTNWLCSESVPSNSGLVLQRRHQTHVGICSDTLAADDSVLFSHDVVETLEREDGNIAEWAIGAEVDFAASDEVEDLTGGFSTLGADGRLIRVERLQSKIFEAPHKLLQAFESGSSGLRLTTVTPACFTRGWLPDGLALNGSHYRGWLPGIDEELILRGALIPRPLHISGWDMAARKPKPTSRMVAPGTVYFLQRADGLTFSDRQATNLWLQGIGTRLKEGFGRVVPGIWQALRVNN